MEKSGSYGQFCPVAMAAELVCTRWTPLVLRELLAGSTRFNDLRKGVPRMSPALLSTRLKELEDAGIIERRRDPAGGGHDYHLTRLAATCGRSSRHLAYGASAGWRRG